MQTVAFDRWRIDILRKELAEAGIDLPLTEFGQGFKALAMGQVISPPLAMAVRVDTLAESPAAGAGRTKGKARIPP